MQTHYDRTLNEKKKGKEDVYLAGKGSKGRWGKEMEKERKRRGRRRGEGGERRGRWRLGKRGGEKGRREEKG